MRDARLRAAERLDRALGLDTRYIYIAGPMRGLPRFGADRFTACEAWLQANISSPPPVIFNPARVDQELGFDFSDCTGHEDLADLGFDLAEAMRRDLDFIVNYASDVVMLPGWQHSSGATHEHATAQLLDVAIHYFYPNTPNGGQLRSTPFFIRSEMPA